MSTLYKELAGFADAYRNRAPVTARLEYVEQATEKAVRLVASFSRDPSSEECAEALGKEIFGGNMEMVPNSFRKVDTGGSRTVLSGFMRPAVDEKPIEELSSMREVVEANAYMEEGDNNIWHVDKDNNRLVRTISEDLSEVLETASVHVQPGIQRKPVLALANVPEKIDGPENTHYLAYINPELDVPEVSFGARVDDDHVLDRETGSVVEIGQNLVVQMSNMRGRDRMLAYGDDEPNADTAGYGRDKMVEYYRRVYGYNPAWLNQFEDIINKSAWA